MLMAINNIRPIGDDQQWKAEVERVIEQLQREVEVLRAQVNARSV